MLITNFQSFLANESCKYKPGFEWHYFTMHQHGPVIHSFSCLFPPSFGCGEWYSLVQYCKGDCFAPSLEQTTLKCHIHLQIIWEKAWLLWAKVWTIQVNSLPSSYFFAQLLETFLSAAVQCPTLLPLSLRSTDCGTKGCGWVVSGCHLCPAQSFSFTLFSAAHSTCAVTGTLRTALGSEGPQNTTAENTSQFSSWSKERIRNNKEIEE